MRTLIITGGTIEKDFALDFILKYQPEYVIAVDRGLSFCYGTQVKPDLIVGDFDSLPSEILEYYKLRADIPIRSYNPVKDATDTCIALEAAIEKKSTEIYILGATGTRIDHVFCNLQILVRSHQAGIPTYLLDARNRISLPVEQEFTIRREEQFGDYVSFFPLEKEVRGLTLEGFKYPVQKHLLKNLDGLGVSNEISAPVARVSYEEGILVMMQTRD